MASISQSQIQFNNINADAVYKRSGKYTHGSNANGNKFDTTITGEELTPSFNAIEIDWNGAAFKSAVDAINTVPDNGAVQQSIQNITTTGELVNIIAKQQSQIDALIVMVKALYQAVN